MLFHFSFAFNQSFRFEKDLFNISTDWFVSICLRFWCLFTNFFHLFSKFIRKILKNIKIKKITFRCKFSRFSWFVYWKDKLQTNQSTFPSCMHSLMLLVVLISCWLWMCTHWYVLITTTNTIYFSHTKLNYLQSIAQVEMNFKPSRWA